MPETFANQHYAAERFREIVDYARTNNPFYARWITDPENPPILDRMTAVESNDDILGGHAATGMTSGSTGTPIRYAQSRDWLKLAKQDIAGFVRGIGGIVPVARIVSARPDRSADAFAIGRPANEQIEFILRRHREIGAVGVTTYPSNAELLCRAVIESGTDMGFVTRFGMYTEAVEPLHRQLVSQAFPNARIWTTYTTKEFMLVAWMCPYEPEYHHISAHRLGVEVVRDDGTPVDEGERGRVVVTDYFNRLSPFIRYDLGDLAILGKCPCGRIAAPSFQRIFGKVLGTLLHRDGNRISASTLSERIREIRGIRQSQIIQDGVEEITVKVIAERPIDTEISEAFRHALGYVPDQLTVEQVSSIPRDVSGKFYWCRSRV